MSLKLVTPMSPKLVTHGCFFTPYLCRKFFYCLNDVYKMNIMNTIFLPQSTQSFFSQRTQRLFFVSLVYSLCPLSILCVFCGLKKNITSPPHSPRRREAWQTPHAFNNNVQGVCATHIPPFGGAWGGFYQIQLTP